jgi:Ser/Thr protein kinase RdoA (MazF antagonist)
MTDPHPYSRLTPDLVLNALDARASLRRRLLALNSYENRVYQVGTEDGGAVVAKFYRPGRWSDEQVLEEHAFATELEAAEIPVVAPLVLEGKTLHHDSGFAFAAYPRRGGRAPELEDEETLQWLGRFIGRIHALGATRPFRHRPALDIAAFGEEPRAYLLASGLIPGDLVAAWTQAAALALEGVRHASTAPEAWPRSASRRLPRIQRAVDAGERQCERRPHFVDFDDAAWRPRSRTCGCWCRETAIR